MNRRNFLKRGMVLAGSITIAGCSGDTNSQNGGSNSNGNGNAPAQEQPSGTRWYDSETEIGVMEGVEAEVDRIGSMYIRGTAQNFSDTDYEYVQLSFAVYDETDAKIADGLANTSGLSSGQRWRFEALAPSAENAASYGLTDVSAY